MAELLKRVKVESELLGLCLNVSKTKIIAIGADSMQEPLIIDGNEVESVSKFNFLGSLITKEGGCSQEIRNRLAMACSAMTNLSKIGADRGITRTTKVRLVQALVFPIALYTSETWTHNKADRNRIEAFQFRCAAGGACFASHGLEEGPVPVYWKKLVCLNGSCIPFTSKCWATLAISQDGRATTWKSS